MHNHEVAIILNETADLMEIDGQDSFRIRSYRNAAQAIENLTERLEDIIRDPKRKLTEIPSIGKAMEGHIQEIWRTGRLTMREEMAARYSPVALELMHIQGLGPKGISTLLSHYPVKSLDEVAELAQQGKLRDLPRMGEKLEQKVIKSIEAYRRSSGRFHINVADETAQQLKEYLAQCPGVEQVTPAGSLRRGCETIGDVDLLVTGGSAADVAAHFVAFPQIAGVLGQGDNKVSVKLAKGIQVDVRMLPAESFGAALQYFTGSKAHNVALRDRAKRMGYKLSEYGLFRIADDVKVAGATEQEIYAALGLDYIEPELRENCGEIEAAANKALPRLVRLEDIRGDLHMHTTETDGRCSMREMVEAAKQRGLEYIAITDHSKALAMANGLNETRVLAQIQEIRQLNSEMENFKVLAGSEVDILQNGDLDLDNEVLAQLDVVVASVHSYMNLSTEQMTERLLRVLENPHLCVLGHPTGRLLLRRDPYPYHVEQIVAEAARRGVAMEINSFPDRLDLRDVHVRLCKQHGVKLVISTDSHHTKHLANIKYGVLMARRGWAEQQDVLNTLPLAELMRAFKRS